MAVSSKREFLRARGHPVDDYTDYGLEEEFEHAFRNWRHELVEQSYLLGLLWTKDGRQWRDYIDDLHRTIEGQPARVQTAADQLREACRNAGLPVLN